MNVIVTLIVYIIVLGLIWYLVKLLPIPAPFSQIVDVLFILLAILAILGAFGVLPALPHLRF